MSSFETLLGPAGLSLALLYVHWLSLVGLFAASAARYSFIAREDTDQHRLFIALGMHRLALLLWMLAVTSGVGLALLSGRTPEQFLQNGLWPVKLGLVLLGPLLTFLPWWYIRQHAVIRSYGWVDIPGIVRVLLRLELASYCALLLVALLLRAGIVLHWR